MAHRSPARVVRSSVASLGQLFFFSSRRRHTRLQGDWSSDVCSSDLGVACVEAIEAAGWQVVMPSGHVCCGRPLYDYGFLDLAERYLRHTLGVLRDEIRDGTPVVGMEPSCLAVFKDELTGMLPHDDDA